MTIIIYQHHLGHPMQTILTIRNMGLGIIGEEVGVLLEKLQTGLRPDLLLNKFYQKLKLKFQLMYHKLGH